MFGLVLRRFLQNPGLKPGQEKGSGEARPPGRAPSWHCGRHAPETEPAASAGFDSRSLLPRASPGCKEGPVRMNQGQPVANRPRCPPAACSGRRHPPSEQWDPCPEPRKALPGPTGALRVARNARFWPPSTHSWAPNTHSAAREGNPIAPKALAGRLEGLPVPTEAHPVAPNTLREAPNTLPGPRDGVTSPEDPRPIATAAGHAETGRRHAAPDAGPAPTAGLPSR